MKSEDINSSRQELFDHMSNEHGLTLLQSEMMEIERIVLASEIEKLQSSQSEAMEKDVITHNTHHKFKLWDRIKILLGKKLTVHSEIETKNMVMLSGKVKCTTTVSRLFPIPKKESQGKWYTLQNLQMDKKQKPEINSSRQELFDYMSQEHGLTLLQSEMMEIEKIVLQSSQSEAVDKGALLEKLNIIHALLLKKQYNHARGNLGTLIYCIESDDEFLKLKELN